MKEQTQTMNLDGIIPQIERLKSFHQGCLNMLERIQSEMRADWRKATLSAMIQASYGSGYKLFGQWFKVSTGNEIFVGVLRHFAELDSGFPERFASRLSGTGRTRRYIARNKDDLYPGRPDLSRYSEQFYPGWYVGTNESNAKKLNMLRTACEVIGIVYNVDLFVRMP